MQTLKYDGSDLVVHFAPKGGDLVCITFPPLGLSSEAKASFFAHKPLSKSGISAIGIMSKRDHWLYTEDPNEEIEVMNLVAELASQYKNVVILAASMGAHAALRYASRLKAQAVLALAPKWSIDPAIFPSVPAHYVTENFRPWMRGMKIDREGTVGVARVYLVYDPHDETDALHARRIMSELADITPIPFFYAGHDIPPVISGSENIASIIRGLNDLAPPEFISMIQRIRRRHPNMTRRIISEHGAQRHPALCLRLMKQLEAGKPGFDGRKVTRDPVVLARLLFSLRSDQDATNDCLILLNKKDCPPSFQSIHRGDPSAAGVFNLLTYHGQTVCFDLLNERVFGCHNTHTDRSSLMLTVDTRDVELNPFVEFHGRRYYLRVDGGRMKLCIEPDRRLRLVESLSEMWFRLRFGASRAERVYLLATECGFAGFHPGGGIGYSDRDMPWEAIILVPAIDGTKTILRGREKSATLSAQ